MTPDNWTEARVIQLKLLHEQKYSASETAAALGGVTRNAVIGKWHRLGLERRGKNGGNKINVGKRERPAQTKRVRYSKQIRHTEIVTDFDLLPLRCVEVVSRNLTVLELEPNDCRFIEGSDRLHCGQPKFRGSKSYCLDHYRISRNEYQPSNVRPSTDLATGRIGKRAWA